MAGRFLDAKALVQVDLGEAPLPLRLTFHLFQDHAGLHTRSAHRHFDAISPGLPGHAAHRSIVSEL
jgi:hypothetical protein